MNKITLEIPDVEISLGYEKRRDAFKFTNLHFCGKESLPLEEKATKEHQDAHWNICAGRQITILVDIDEKGNWSNIRVKEKT